MAKPKLSKDGFFSQKFEHGFDLYIKKDLNGAINAFTEVVDNSTDGTLVKALDSRAACYEKLEDFRRALQDGKRMIKVKPDSSKGYLRTGKILCLNGKKEIALKIYERGLSKVKIGTDRERALLDSIYYRLKSELNRYDPFQILPMELAYIICKNLELCDLSVCLVVSKGWKTLLESFRSLWTTLDTTYIHNLIPVKSLKIFLRRSNYTLYRATISLKCLADRSRLQYIVETCRFLKELELRGSHILDNTQFHLFSSAKEIEKLYITQNVLVESKLMQNMLKNCCQSLVEVRFSNVQGSRYEFINFKWPKLDALKSITLRASDNGAIDMNYFLEATPNVTTVVLDRFEVLIKQTLDLRSWSHLKRLHLLHAGLLKFPKLPQTLQHLVLDKNPNLSITDELEKEDLFSLPLLETFYCQSTSIELHHLFAITKACIQANNFKSLGIGGHYHNHLIMVSYSTNKIPKNLPPSLSLEELSLALLPITDNQILEILQLYPKLRKIDLSGTCVTGVTIKALIEKGGVEWIKVSDQMSVSFDAIELARNKGIYVDFRPL
ncbi:putative f-box tpr repeat containing protein pof3 [Erysiphe neolycopersici]|uniref:Putative f-box tpr repeat containing protein pof3 n=1 Tax=Erysiphe neolycopersici TaxID=212602 RepID=A0A420I0V3_9PEZI|nr:putative f-box tpr repeat containing protein pof3 [Erysiphe neolycopersici]